MGDTPYSRTSEKCRKFLVNLIVLSTSKAKPAEENLRNLIQELMNANIEPEEFCDRLEQLLDICAQPCLIGFLKENLPSLRRALFTREVEIEGIKPSPTNIVTRRTVKHIQEATNAPHVGNAQIRETIPTTIQWEQSSNAQLPTTLVQTNIVNIGVPPTTPSMSVVPTNLSTYNSVTTLPTTNTFGSSGMDEVKEEVFFHSPALRPHIRALITEQGMEQPSQDVVALISIACRERIKSIVEDLLLQMAEHRNDANILDPHSEVTNDVRDQKRFIEGLDNSEQECHEREELLQMAEHRNDANILDPHSQVTNDVRDQKRFIEDLDNSEQECHEREEVEMLNPTVKSGSNAADPEQAKVEVSAEKIQCAKLEGTAFQAIGSHKKLKLDSGAAIGDAKKDSSGVLGCTNVAAAPLEPRIKRIDLGEMLLYMEQKRLSFRADTLYKAFLK